MAEGRGRATGRRQRIAPRGGSPRSAAKEAPARLGPSLHGGPPIDLVHDPTLATIVAVVALVLVAVAFVLVAWLARRVGRLQARLEALTRGADGRDLGAVLDRHLDTVLAVSRELESLGGRTLRLEEGSRFAFQRIGLVRFNPFEDTGGNQSFALALLDADDDGFVLTSLHARSGTRMYAKALSGGRSDSALSAEETEALRLAMAGRTGRAPRAS